MPIGGAIGESGLRCPGYTHTGTVRRATEPRKAEPAAVDGTDRRLVAISRSGTVVGMAQNLTTLAAAYHQALPPRIRRYLNARGISDEVIALHRLGWNGRRIAIPISDRRGLVAFFKFAKDPDVASPGPKMLCSVGGALGLYGWERVLAKPNRLVICEGEFDRLALESRGLPAATSTGGAGAFRSEWVADFADIPEVFICFDRDRAGRRGALRVGALIARARIVELPEEVRDGGDVTDFFVRLGRSRDDFCKLLDRATPAPVPPASLPVRRSTRTRAPVSRSDRVAALKAAVPIEVVVAGYVPLRESTTYLRGRCPFHNDREPSLAVYPATGTFHCFGCGARGDVIDFLRRIDDLTFPEALDALEPFQTHGDGGTEAQP